MKHCSKIDIFTIGLCILALFVAQMFGAQRGYICKCGGEPVQTQTSHCHGPHDANCHSDAEDGDAAHHEQESGDREDHEVVEKEVHMSLAKAMAHVIAPQVITAILPQPPLFLSLVEARLTVSYRMDFGDSPPSGVTVARTIVLLV